MSEIVKKTIKPLKKTLNELLQDKSIITGREVIQELTQKEKLQSEFDASIEFEQRNRKSRI